MFLFALKLGNTIGFHRWYDWITFFSLNWLVSNFLGGCEQILPLHLFSLQSRVELGMRFVVVKIPFFNLNLLLFLKSLFILCTTTPVFHRGAECDVVFVVKHLETSEAGKGFNFVQGICL